jgi:hypothetical protein
VVNGAGDDLTFFTVLSIDLKRPRKRDKMGNVKKIVKTRYIDEDEGFEYTFEPVEDSITIKKIKGGFEARYLVRDDFLDRGPDDEGDDNLFLVHYHRDFEIKRDSIITKNDLRNWYRDDFEDYKEDPDDENEVAKFPLSETYHIFPVAAYIHGGVVLSLGSGSHFPDQRWDVSHVGAVLVSKKEWEEEGKAWEAAKGHVETWNQYLSGDVYGCVLETYDKKKNQIDHDSCWGFYGHKYALEEIKTFRG